MASFQGDDSEEGAATRQELKNELNDLKADLEETQYQKAIAEHKKLLDELYTEYETVLNIRGIYCLLDEVFEVIDCRLNASERGGELISISCNNTCDFVRSVCQGVSEWEIFL